MEPSSAVMSKARMQTYRRNTLFTDVLREIRQ